MTRPPPLDGIRVLDDAFTAQCFITTDLDDNQITAFHSGAMDRAHEARLDGVREPVELAIVAPNGKRAMQEYARELKRRGVPAELLLFPGEGHELTRSGRPQHRLVRFEHVLDWWERTLPVA